MTSRISLPQSPAQSAGAAPPPPPARPLAAGVRRLFSRRWAKWLGLAAAGYLALWLCSVLGMLGLSAWAGQHHPTGSQVAGINNFLRVDDRLLRGAAPGPEGYRELAERGVTAVVDLRAEDLPARELAEPRQAGLDAVRLPIRDGQTPTDAQVDRLLRAVDEAEGDVFVHCGAGVGRTGSITSAYLLRTGQAGSLEAAARTLAVGPPSIEQVYYVLTAGEQDADQPPAAVSAVSRLLDAPRRIASYL